MRALKVILDLLVLAYVVFTVLLLTSVLNEDTILSSSTQVLDLYKGIAAAGGVLMLAKVLVSRLYIADLKHEQHLAQLKINELKANLYEKRQEFRSNSYQYAKADEMAEAGK